MTDSKKSRNKPSLRGSQVSFTKKKVSTKTSDIYERFLSRVQQIDNNDTAKDSNKNADNADRTDDDGLDFDLNFTLPTESRANDAQASFAPDNEGIEPDFLVVENTAVESLESVNDPEITSHDLSATPMATIIAQTMADEEAQGGNHDNNQDDDQSSESEVTETAVPLAPLTKNVTPKKQKAEPSKMKTLVVGVICGLVISGSAIAILNSLGVISLQSPNSPADQEVNADLNSQVSATTENSPNSNAKVQSVPKIVAENQPKSENTANAAAKAEAKPNTESEVTPPPKSATKSEPSGQQDSNLSYQDFAEEAGTTLYRDSN